MAKVLSFLFYLSFFFVEKRALLKAKIEALPEEVEVRDTEFSIVASLLIVSQSFCRAFEGDLSAVSLRDVKRSIDFMNFFLSIKTKLNEKFLALQAVALGLAFVYFYRQSKGDSRFFFFFSKLKSFPGIYCWLNRSGYWEQLFQVKRIKSIKGARNTFFAKCYTGTNSFGSVFRSTVATAQENFCKKLSMESDIALNVTLKENLFVCIFCILNRVPVFLVGKPGTSKSITFEFSHSCPFFLETDLKLKNRMQIISSNLNGEQSARKFWRQFPAVHVFPYQCSPMSDSQSILHQYRMTVRFQEHAPNTITVLLLDEVGLAEHSPDMPLKVLSLLRSFFFFVFLFSPNIGSSWNVGRPSCRNCGAEQLGVRSCQNEQSYSCTTTRTFKL